MDDTQKSKKLKSARKLGFYLLIIGFILILISGILGLRIFDRISNRPPPVPRETNLTLIQDWMTIPYISRTYGVPGPVLFEELNIDPQQYRNSSISQIAEKTNQDSAQLLNSVKNIITNYQSTHNKPRLEP